MACGVVPFNRNCNCIRQRRTSFSVHLQPAFVCSLAYTQAFDPIYIYTLFVLAVAIVMASSSAGPSHSQTIAPHTEFWPDVALVLPNKGSMARDMVCKSASPLHT